MSVKKFFVLSNKLIPTFWPISMFPLYTTAPVVRKIADRRWSVTELKM